MCPRTAPRRTGTAKSSRCQELRRPSLGSDGGEADRPVLRHQDEIHSVAFSQDGALVVTASKDKTVRLWDALTGDPVGRPMLHPSVVKYAVFTPDSRRIVTGSDDASVRVWDALGGDVIVGPFQEGQRLDLMLLSEDGRRLLTVAFTRGVVWDVLTGKPLVSSITTRENQSRRPPSAAMKVPRHRFDLGGERARLERRAGKPVGPLLMHNGALRSLDFSPDGRWLLTASHDKTARLWDVATSKQLGTPFQHEDKINSASFSPDGRRIITASDDTTVRVWDVSIGESVATPLRDEYIARSAAFSADGRRLVTASWDDSARVWDVGSGRPLTPPLRHLNDVVAAMFSLTDGGSSRHRLTGRRASGMRARGLRSARRSSTGPDLLLSSARTDGASRPRRPTRRHASGTQHGQRADRAARARPRGQERSLQFGRPVDRHRLGGRHRAYLGSGDRETVGAPLRHLLDVNVAAFSPDGRRLLTASNDRTARVWDTITRAAIGRPLSMPISCWRRHSVPMAVRLSRHPPMAPLGSGTR